MNHETPNFKTLALAFVLAPLALGLGCGLDPLVWGKLTPSDFEDPPPAGFNTVTGVASAMGAGATVRFLGPAGGALPEQDTATDADGAFSAQFPAGSTFTNTIVSVSDATRAFWGVVPEVPRKETVYDADIIVTLGTGLPEGGEAAAVAFMDDLGVESTVATLMLLAKVRFSEPPSTLATVSPSAVVGALDELAALVSSGDSRVVALSEMVERLLTDGATTRPPLRPFVADGGSYLDFAALSPGLDYSGDGSPDTSVAAFDSALRAAVAAFDFNVCYAPDRIRVVLMVDFNEGGVDRNCSTINRWKWTKDEAGKQMFITGSLHESTPNCDRDPAPCLESAVFDAASQQLGNWTPNITPMFDDGTNGDEVAGDNVWTLSLEMPWFDAGAPENPWVRISYKYTWGTAGALWTGSEEWPGNQRILELRDINGDRMIVRRDLYGDETTNKDKSNLLAPAKGGCGTVLWESELNPPPEGRRENCVDDTLENMIDTDGDCVLDSYPSPGTATPITIPCPE